MTDRELPHLTVDVAALDLSGTEVTDAGFAGQVRSGTGFRGSDVKDVRYRMEFLRV